MFQAQNTLRLHLIEYLLQLNFFKNLSTADKIENANALNQVAGFLNDRLATEDVSNPNLVSVISNTLNINQEIIVRGPDNDIISPLSDVVSPHVLEYSPRTTINSTSISQIHNQYSVELLEKCQQQHEHLLSLTNMNTASRILKPTSANIGRENYMIKYILSTLKEQGHQIFDRIDDLIGTLLRAAVVAAETFEAAVFAIFTDLMPLLFEYCFVSFYFLPISFVVVPMIDIINQFWGTNLYFSQPCLNYYTSQLGSSRHGINTLISASSIQPLPRSVDLSLTRPNGGFIIRPPLTYGFAGFCAITFGMFLHHYVENHIITQTLRAINNALRSVPDLPNRLAVVLTEDAILYRDLVSKIVEEFIKLIS